MPPDAPYARAALAAGLALLSAVLAVALPDFGFLVAFVGALCVGVLAFVLPPAIYLALAGAAELRPAVRAAHAALLVLGVLVTVGATAKVLADKVQAS